MTAFLYKYWVYVLIAGILAAFWIIVNLYGRHLKNMAERESKEEKVPPVAEIQINTGVILDSGIHGSIREIRDRTFMVEIAKGVVIEVEKYGVVFVSDKEGRKSGRAAAESRQFQTAGNA